MGPRSSGRRQRPPTLRTRPPVPPSPARSPRLRPRLSCARGRFASPCSGRGRRRRDVTAARPAPACGLRPPCPRDPSPRRWWVGLRPAARGFAVLARLRPDRGARAPARRAVSCYSRPTAAVPRRDERVAVRRPPPSSRPPRLRPQPLPPAWSGCSPASAALRPVFRCLRSSPRDSPHPAAARRPVVLAGELALQALSRGPRL